VSGKPAKRSAGKVVGYPTRSIWRDVAENARLICMLHGEQRTIGFAPRSFPVSERRIHMIQIVAESGINPVSGTELDQGLRTDRSWL